MLGTTLAATVVFAGSLLAGHGLCRLAGHGRDAWHAGAVGLALLTAVAGLAVKLPGEEVTVLVLVLLLAAGGAAVLGLPARPPPAELLVLLVLLLAALSVPFLVNGRVGLLGVGFNNDLSVHLPWIDALRSDAAAEATALPSGYPLGPHGLVAAIAALTGANLEQAITGLMIATVLLFALATQAVLTDVARPLRVLAGLLASLAYLFASYYAQGAFKELMFSLLLLSTALMLRHLAARAPLSRLALLPLGIVLAGTLYTYSYYGVAWLLLVCGAWGVGELVSRGALWPPGVALSRLRPLVLPAAIGLAALAVALIPEADRLANLFRETGVSPAGEGAIVTSNLGNLAHALSRYEVFGLWRSDDFRFSPEAFNAGLWSALGLLVAVYGAIWWLARRDLALPVTLAVSGAIYLYADQQESAYISAKALAIASPIVVLVGARALLARQASKWPPEASLLRLAAVVLFTFGALSSSYLSLRNAQVGPANDRDDLAELRRITGGSKTLFLGHDDYYRWNMSPTPVSHPQLVSHDPAPLQLEKDWAYGEPFDFDSVSAQTLDTFAYVVTPNGAYQSAPYDSFELLRETDSFQLWRRERASVQRSILTEKGGPFALFDCAGKRSHRRLSRKPGVASVVPKPLAIQGPGGFVEDREIPFEMRLPAGRWDVSLQYTGTQWVTLEGGGLDAHLPPRLSRPGPFWNAGTIEVADGARPIRFVLSAEDPSPLYARAQATQPGVVAATRADLKPRLLPLGEACGQWVDWYRLES